MLARFAYLAAGIYIAIAFFDAITVVLLLGLLAVILAMALNTPVTWLEQRKLNRTLAVAAVLLGVLIVVGLLAWLVVPRVVAQTSTLASALPGYITTLSNRVANTLNAYPALRDRFQLDEQSARASLSSAWTVARRVGRYSMSVLTALILFIVLISLVIYMLTNPRPLLQGVLTIPPPHLREPIANALTRSSRMVSGWILSNVIVGGVEAVAATIFLAFIGVPL